MPRWGGEGGDGYRAGRGGARRMCCGPGSQSRLQFYFSSLAHEVHSECPYCIFMRTLYDQLFLIVCHQPVPPATYRLTFPPAAYCLTPPSLGTVLLCSCLGVAGGVGARHGASASQVAGITEQLIWRVLFFKRSAAPLIL